MLQISAVLMDAALNAAVKGFASDIIQALQFAVPVIIVLFIITRALGERTEIKMLIGEGILAAIGLELLFAFARGFMG